MNTSKKLKRVKLQRAQTRRFVTLAIDSVKDVSDIEEIDVLLLKFDDYARQLEKFDEDVSECLCEDDEENDDVLEEEITKAAQIRDEVMNVVALLRIRREEATKSASKLRDVCTTVFADSLAPKMPIVKIPFFSGDILTWPTFWDSFKAHVHNNPHYSKVTKMTYLLDHMKGEAQGALRNFQITDACYDEAINLLKERFGREQEVKFAHMLELLNIQPATKESELRDTVDKIEGHLRCLSSLGFDEDDNSELFTCLLLAKIPPKVRTELTRLKGNGDWNLKDLRRLLSDELRALESWKLTSAIKDDKQAKPPSKPHSSFTPNKHGNHFSTTQALVASAHTPSCAFCPAGSKPHFSDECTQFTSVQDRKTQIGNNCFKCLKPNHLSKNCKRQRPCYHCKSHDHHSALCPKRFSRRTQEHDDVALYCDIRSSSNDQKVSHNTSSILPLATVKIQCPDDVCKNSKCVMVKTVMDTGSGRSYITETAANQLGLRPTGYEILSYSSFGSEKSKTRKVPYTLVDMCCADGSTLPIPVTIVPVITAPVMKKALNVERFPVLKSVNLAEPLAAEPENITVDMLIGLDFYFQVIGHERINLSDKLVLMHTRFGWVIAGSLHEPPTSSLDITDAHPDPVLLSPSTVDPLNLSVERMWSLDAIGVTEDCDVTFDDMAINKFNETVNIQDNRYHVSWPWKEGHLEPPDNFALSAGRLKSLLNRLKHTPEIRDKYHDVIMDQLRQGIIETVDIGSANSQEDNRVVHYLPHHHVLKDDGENQKLRIVFDASAKTSKSGISLNDCLIKGPSLLPQIAGLLLRFRMFPIGVTADIEKAFLQIGLNEPDRDACRFLWVDNPSDSTPILRNLTTFRFRRVPFGVISSPFLLTSTIKHHLQSSESTHSERILKNIYVDNLVLGESNVAAASEVYKFAKETFNSANMNLRDWSSNSPEFLDSIPSDDKLEMKETKLLGMVWNQKKDTLHLAPVKDTSQPPVTKRLVLQVVSKFFDPLGICTPVLIQAKLLIQEIWKRKFDWDTPLDEEISTRWWDLQEDFSFLSTIEVTRYVTSPSASFELHAFSDASKSCYGACVYLRSASKDGSIQSTLIFSKSRTAPTKEITIPRLELLGALIATRILHFVSTEIGMEPLKTFLWIDSKCVLYWIKSKRTLPVFVHRRISEIRRSSVQEFRFVPTKDNPADMITRGQPAEALSQNLLWWEGPEWLQRDQSQWPENLTINEKDFKEDTDPTTEALLVPEQTPATPFDLDTDRFSSLKRLLSVTAWCLRAVSRFKRRNEETEAGMSLTAKEINSAKLLWIQHVQETHFPKGMEKERANLKSQLGLFVCEKGLIHCSGRLSNIACDETKRFPILLPKNSRFTTLVIRDAHERTMHSGMKQTLSTLRNEYWIPAGRSQVHGVLKKCSKCRRHEGGSFLTPNPPPLPSHRVNHEYPFAVTGIDYFGPLLITAEETPTKKVWVCLFTCSITRAVHLEIAESLSTTDFTSCLRRFIATRGTPQMFISDNARNFKLGKTCVDKIWFDTLQHKEVQSYIAQRSIRWNFIVEMAPWMGGFYERLIGSVKRSLKKNVGCLLLSLLQLQTILKEIETVVNSRPLTYCGEDIDDYPALTPSHFLSFPSLETGCPAISLQTNPTESENKESVENVLQLWKRGQQHLNAFWKSWLNDYLLSLREFHKIRKPRNAEMSSPRLGQVVLIRMKGVPRGRWKLGKILGLNKSSDGIVRSATLKTTTQRSCRRPLSLLIPLEADGVPSETPTEQSNTEANKRQNDIQNPPRLASRTTNRRAKLAALSHMFCRGSVGNNVYPNKPE